MVANYIKLHAIDDKNRKLLQKIIIYGIGKKEDMLKQYIGMIE